MKMLFAILFTTPFAQNLYAQNTSTFVNQFVWLEGNWLAATEEGFFLECWKEENDSTFIAVAYYFPNNGIIKKESITMETIKNSGRQMESIILRKRENVIAYVPIAHGQNNEEAIIFTLIKYDNMMVQFENPAHDFPQVIMYEFKDAAHITATVSAIINGSEIKQVFEFSKFE